jgi:hypothetical protein
MAATGLGVFLIALSIPSLLPYISIFEPAPLWVLAGIGAVVLGRELCDGEEKLSRTLQRVACSTAGLSIVFLAVWIVAFSPLHRLSAYPYHSSYTLYVACALWCAAGCALAASAVLPNLYLPSRWYVVVSPWAAVVVLLYLSILFLSAAKYAAAAVELMLALLLGGFGANRLALMWSEKNAPFYFLLLLSLIIAAEIATIFAVSPFIVFPTSS